MQYTVTTIIKGRQEIFHCRDWQQVERILWLLERTDFNAYVVSCVSEVCHG